MCVLCLLPGLGCFSGVILLLFVKVLPKVGLKVICPVVNANNGKPLQIVSRRDHLDLTGLVFWELEMISLCEI